VSTPEPDASAARDAAQQLREAEHPLARLLWLLLAFTALILGVIGIVVPGLPTTPFVLLAAFAAARGSKHMHRWLRRHRRFGPMIADWEREGAIASRTRRVAFAMMTLAAIVLWFVVPAWWMAAIAWATMASVALWMSTRPLPAAERVGRVPPVSK
jgi:hypothetical protein